MSAPEFVLPQTERYEGVIIGPFTRNFAARWDPQVVDIFRREYKSYVQEFIGRLKRNLHSCYALNDEITVDQISQILYSESFCGMSNKFFQARGGRGNDCRYCPWYIFEEQGSVSCDELRDQLFGNTKDYITEQALDHAGIIHLNDEILNNWPFFRLFNVIIQYMDELTTNLYFMEV